MDKNVKKINKIAYQFLKETPPNYSIITRSDMARDLIKNTVKIAKSESEDLSQLQPISSLGASITWDETDHDKFLLSYGNLRIEEDSDTEDDKITYVFPSWPEATVEKLLPDDKIHNLYFGFSVDADGDYFIIGQPGPTVGMTSASIGRAYIYHKDGSTINRTELVPSFNSTYVNFGHLVKIKGDYAVVVLRGRSTTLQGFNDRIFIFKKTETNTWSEEFSYYFNRNRACDSVSVNGDYVIVSENKYIYDDVRGSRVAIFYRDPTNGWEFNSEIIQPYPPTYGETHYTTTSADGNYIVAAFKNEEVGGLTNAGAIYIYEKTGPSTWENEYRIVSPSPKTYSEMSKWGESISISGDYLGIKDDRNNFFMYRRSSGNVWDDVFTFPPLEGRYQYGSIYVKGDYCIIMSRTVYQGDDYAAGEATIFQRTDTNTWTEIRKIWSPVPIQQSYFGASTAMGNNYFIAGNYSDIDIGDIKHGSAWLFSY